MRRGFGFIRLEGTSSPVEWAKGEVERTKLTHGARTDDREVFGLRAWLCGDCGKVELEAETGKETGA